MSKETEAFSISDALFTKAQQCVLGILFAQGESSFYLNEIVRKAGMGTGAIQRELNKLVSSGLVVMQKQGNQNYYSANHKSPVYAELRSIAMKTFGLANVLSESITPIIDELEFAFTYGSVAKGSDHASSDIDVLLVGVDLGYSQVMELFIDAEERLARTINPTILSDEEFTQRLESKQNFISKVIEQPKIWIMGKESFEAIVS
ncbi:transcriptional regulator [Kangiella spongicola]|uniref:Transcriptional regulator n=1 Tax=Kangiella spongicola TaxID=796379 RepID=A0A318CZS3_9GAMM|nr:transcriptional regulator [Kangiella spongicola]PXF62466.1 transcriptional regulator [Kangiella spongicola]